MDVFASAMVILVEIEMKFKISIARIFKEQHN